jgi:hypothetical protein
MEGKNIREAAAEVFRDYEENFRGPFPYADCRKLLSEAGGGYDGLIPALDMYFSNIAGYCSSVGRIAAWTDERKSEARRTLEKSFFEKHPEFSPLRPGITESDTPALFKGLTLCDNLRVRILGLLSEFE